MPERKSLRNVLGASWAGILIALAVVAYGAWLYPRLPELAATHFDRQGAPDRYSSRLFLVLFMPALLVFVQLLVPTLLHVSPPEFQAAHSWRAVTRVNFAVAVLLAGLQVGLLQANLHPGSSSMAFFFCFSCAIFLVIVGNVLSKLERNFFIGIRTPWTLASEHNWAATHRFAARWMVATGVLLYALSCLRASFPLAIAAMLVAALGPVGYSYWFFTRREAGR